MVCQEIKDFLAAHADARYAAFVTSLMPGARPVVGVRLPVLRALAKEIAKGDWRTYLEEAVDDTFEEVMLQGYVTGAARMPFEEHIDYMERREPKETAYPITIGEDCWLGGGVVVCPGVTIGNRCVIAAGSVVVKDIPDDSLAAGCPAVVKKRLNGKAGVVEQ